MKFAVEKQHHILQSSNIYWADQSKRSKSTYLLLLLYHRTETAIFLEELL